MIPVTQTRTGDRGNCFAACLASVLETPLPEFGLAGDDEYWRNVDRWLAERGLRYRQVSIAGNPAPVGWGTLEGVSPRGGMHACVARNGVLVHDPHPQDGTGRGLVKPMYYGVLSAIGANTVRAKDAVRPTWQRNTPSLGGLLDSHDHLTKLGYEFKYSSGQPGGKSIQHIYRRGGSEANRPTAIIHEYSEKSPTYTFHNQSRATDRASLHRALDAVLDRKALAKYDAHKKARDADAHVGMLGVNADKAKTLKAQLESKGFEYRFPIEPPKAEMVRHGFLKRGPDGDTAKNERRILNERKNGYHNVTVL